MVFQIQANLQKKLEYIFSNSNSSPDRIDAECQSPELVRVFSSPEDTLCKSYEHHSWTKLGVAHLLQDMEPIGLYSSSSLVLLRL